jgi:hypothetical protein
MTIMFIAALDSLGVVPGRGRVSRNNEPGFFQNLVVNRCVISSFAEFDDAISARQRHRSDRFARQRESRGAWRLIPEGYPRLRKARALCGAALLNPKLNR